MIRLVIENAIIFLAPTLAYIAWQAFKLNDWPGFGAIIRDAPLAKLFVAGAALMLGTLAAVAIREIDSGRLHGPTSAPPTAVFTPETPTQRAP